MRSDRIIGKRTDECATAQSAGRRGAPVWRVNQPQLRELANAQPRNLQGEVVWRVRVD